MSLSNRESADRPSALYLLYYGDYILVRQAKGAERRGNRLFPRGIASFSVEPARKRENEWYLLYPSCVGTLLTAYSLAVPHSRNVVFGLI